MRPSNPPPNARLVSRWTPRIALGCALGALTACADSERSPSPGTTTAAATALAAGTTEKPSAGSEPGCEHDKQGGCPCSGAQEGHGECSKRGGEPGHAGCSEDPSTERASDSVREKVDASGRKLTLAGGDLGDATVWTVDQALTKAAEARGSVVQVEGKVTAMCQGKRAWFAVVGEDASAGTLRVLTAPAFLVPVGSMGRRVRVEGRLESIQVSAGAAKHYAEDHHLPSMGDGTGPVDQTVLRATGAEFYDP